MASVMDESEIPSEEAKQEAQPKEQPKSIETAEEVKEEEADKEDKKAEATPQEQAPQEEIPQEQMPQKEQPSLPPLSLSFDLQTLLKDLPIDPKILENKTLHVQVQLADKTWLPITMLILAGPSGSGEIPLWGIY